MKQYNEDLQVEISLNKISMEVLKKIEKLDIDADSFIQKIEIPIQKNQQGMYDAESVLSILISKLGGNNEENT